jgi:hypothetical protein
VPGSKPLQRVMRCQSASFLDFVERCLDWDPQTRITPYEALMHEWIIEGLPPKVLLHHKKMLGIQKQKSEALNRTQIVNSEQPGAIQLP